MNENLRIRKLKDQKSKVRNQWETQKTGKQKDRNKKDRKQRNK
ncbi:flagellin [Vibrio splendidus 12B01]|nr:flagellin [Vibrio splendidus 12B01]